MFLSLVPHESIATLALLAEKVRRCIGGIGPTSTL